MLHYKPYYGHHVTDLTIDLTNNKPITPSTTTVSFTEIILQYPTIHWPNQWPCPKSANRFTRKTLCKSTHPFVWLAKFVYENVRTGQNLLQQVRMVLIAWPTLKNNNISHSLFYDWLEGMFFFYCRVSCFRSCKTQFHLVISGYYGKTFYDRK